MNSYKIFIWFIILFSFSLQAEVIEYNFEDPNPMLSVDGKHRLCRNSVDKAPWPLFTKEVSREGNQSLKSVINRLDPINNYRMELNCLLPERHTVNKGINTPDYWYGFSLYIPSPHSRLQVRNLNNLWQIFFQIHARPIDDNWSTYIGLSPPLALEIDPITDFTGDILVKIRGTNKPYPQNRNDLTTLIKPIFKYQTDQWIDFVVQGRFTSDNNGFINIWVNGDKVFEFQGSTYYRGHGNAYPLMGLYSGFKNIPKNHSEPVIERTIYHDSLRIALKNGSVAKVSPKPFIESPFKNPKNINLINKKSLYYE